MPSRRECLRGATLTTLAITGCLGRISGSADLDTITEPEVSGEEASATTPTTQFQYDAEHAGSVSSDAPKTKDIRWKTALPHPVVGGLAVADGRVFVVSRGHLIALDAADGDGLWGVDVGHSTGQAPALTADTAYVPTKGGGPPVDQGVVAIDLDDGTQRWRAVPDVDIASAATLAHDTVYVGGSIHSEQVIALDAATGEERWRFPAGIYTPTPTVADGIVYAGGGEDHVVYALDAEDGDELWRYDVDGSVDTAPTVVDETVYVGTRNAEVYALAAATGDERWHISVPSTVSASIAATSEAVYVPAEVIITAHSVEGDKRWSVAVDDETFAPTVTDDSIVLTDQSAVRCLDPTEGTERWRHEPPNRSWGDWTATGIRCEPVVADGVVYVASHGGDVYAFESGV